MTTIAIVGATGHVGRQLATLLLSRGTRVRAIGRSAERLQGLTAQNAEAWVGDAHDPKFLAEAFRGADGVLALVPQLTRPVQEAAGMLKGRKSLTRALMCAAARVVRVEGLPGS